VCGSSLHGKLGIDHLNKTNVNKFMLVASLTKKKIRQVACGDYHTLFLTDDCAVYQSGGNNMKEKRDKSAQKNVSPVGSPNVPQPVQALYGKDIVHIDCGDFHSAALEANGDLYTWGGGASSYNKGQCGHGHNNIVEFPEKVQSLVTKRVTKMACGGFHTLALSSENELYAWGSGVYGECGYGEFYDTNKPKLVKFAQDKQNRDQSNERDGDYHPLNMYLTDQIQIA